MNFRQFDELIHSGEDRIVLDSDVIMADGEDEKYLKGIDLDIDGIVIDAAGHVIDAGWKSAIFNVTCDATVKNATIKRGYSHDEDAYAIFNGADLSFFACTLKDNPTAILTEGNLNVEKCIFEENCTDDWGSAILNLEGTLKATGCIFKANHAQIGGAIFSYDDMVLSGCTFEDNTAEAFGAAIDAEYGFYITGCTFKNNNAKKQGGAIKIFTDDCCIEDSCFAGNTSVCGGAIYNDEGSLKVTGCRFMDFVRRYNDALYNENGNLAVDGCSFIDERVGWSPHGQAIINNANLKLVNSYFKMNPVDGGPVCNRADMDVEDCTFDE